MRKRDCETRRPPGTYRGAPRLSAEDYGEGDPALAWVAAEEPAALERALKRARAGADHIPFKACACVESARNK